MTNYLLYLAKKSICYGCCSSHCCNNIWSVKNAQVKRVAVKTIFYRTESSKCQSALFFWKWYSVLFRKLLILQPASFSSRTTAVFCWRRFLKWAGCSLHRETVVLASRKWSVLQQLSYPCVQVGKLISMYMLHICEFFITVCSFPINSLNAFLSNYSVWFMI